MVLCEYAGISNALFNTPDDHVQVAVKGGYGTTLTSLRNGSIHNVYVLPVLTIQWLMAFCYHSVLIVSPGRSQCVQGTEFQCHSKYTAHTNVTNLAFHDGSAAMAADIFLTLFYFAKSKREVLHLTLVATRIII